MRVRAPLLDRLVDHDPKAAMEVRPLRALTEEELKQVVLRDLSWLLNTRTPIPPEAFDEARLSTIDFGIPDFSSYSPANPDDLIVLARRLSHAIKAFEPRLANIKVSFAKELSGEKSLAVIIDGDLVIENVRKPVSFATILQKEAEKWILYDINQGNTP